MKRIGILQIICKLHFTSNACCIFAQRLTNFAAARSAIIEHVFPLHAKPPKWSIATQDCIHDPTFRHSSPSVFIRGDLMLKTQDLIYSTG